MKQKLSFASDYLEGAHPNILARLVQTNSEKMSGYGQDAYSAAAREKIRAACSAPQAEVYFLVGGTQTNATMIDAFLRAYQGVIAPQSAHIATHEAGAVEAGGHKVIALAHQAGKLSANAVRQCAEEFLQDKNNIQMVMPGMVYISQPTEYGTLYSLRELREISEVCRAYALPLYLDGARLAYALACPDNDVSLSDIASLCDAFYIGGTKCGALFGEAVVIPQPGTIAHMPHFIRQHGALLAKGRVAGLQFDTLFTDGLYETIGRPAIEAADRIRAALREKGYTQAWASPTNQIFIVLEKTQADALSEKVELGFWENLNETSCVMRIATSWATTREDADALIALL